MNLNNFSPVRVPLAGLPFMLAVFPLARFSCGGFRLFVFISLFVS